MAGMFCSLQEVAEMLNKTEDQIKELVKQGRLREFRDGSTLLFKVDEVESFLPKMSTTASKEIPEPETPAAAEQTPPPEQPAEDEILLAEDTGVLAAEETGVPTAEESGLTEGDTAITREGISVLGETDKDYPITEDMMAETVDATGIPSGATGIPSDAAGTAIPETSLEEIEEDVNLDTFGSGSGLLDLSLQADDTSLGGVLDEIYTAEGESAEPAEPGTAGGLTAAEVEELLPDEELAAPQPIPEVAAIAQPYDETGTDAQSNILGKLMILPFIFLIYTAAVIIAGQSGVTLLAAIQGLIWYIVIAAIVVVGLVVGAAFMLTGNFAKAAKKPAKPKKVKEPKKPKKPKKAKKT